MLLKGQRSDYISDVLDFRGFDLKQPITCFVTSYCYWLSGVSILWLFVAVCGEVTCSVLLGLGSSVHWCVEELHIYVVLYIYISVYAQAQN